MNTRLWPTASVCIFGAFIFGACDDSEADRDHSEATVFELRIENVAPWNLLKSGAQSIKVSGASGSAAPGEAYEIRFSAGVGQSVSFATMLAQSNDWFFAPVASGIPLYDAKNNPISGDVTRFVTVWNAGTEYDQEPGVGDSIGTKQPAPGVGAADPNTSVREVPIEIRLSNGATFVRPPTTDMIRVTLTPEANRTFRLRIANVSDQNTLVTSQGTMAIALMPLEWALHIEPAPLFNPSTGVGVRGLEQLAEDGNPAGLNNTLATTTGISTPISPGVFVLHTVNGPLFLPGDADRGIGLEALAEDGDHTALVRTLTGEPIEAFGSFDIPDGSTNVGLASRGQAYVITFDAFEDDRLSFATSFGMSNDWFFGTRPEGIRLFLDDEDDEPITADVTDLVALYDLGTELDQELAVGADTGTQQLAPNVGAIDPDRAIREIDAAVYPQPVSSHLRVTVTHLVTFD